MHFHLNRIGASTQVIESWDVCLLLRLYRLGRPRNGENASQFSQCRIVDRWAFKHNCMNTLHYLYLMPSDSKSLPTFCESALYLELIPTPMLSSLPCAQDRRYGRVSQNIVPINDSTVPIGMRIMVLTPTSSLDPSRQRTPHRQQNRD